MSHPINWSLDELVTELRQRREAWRHARHRAPDEHGREFPSIDALRQVMHNLNGVLFPLRLGPADLRSGTEDYFIGYTLDKTLNLLLEQALLELKFAPDQPPSELATSQQAIRLVKDFASQLPRIRTLLDSDVVAAFRGDPAARSMDEVLLCYPGIRAIISHRLAHALFNLGLPLLARILAEISHSETGIDIHPGAHIGKGFFIDHGTGVVIGETTVIGNNVRLYQAVTLGAKRFELNEQGDVAKGGARHPIIEDEVVIYAGATILGRVTIGKGSSIGGNVWLTHSVPAHSQITQAGSEHRAGTGRAKISLVSGHDE